MKTTIEITETELINMLSKIKGATPISLQYVTKPKINKEGKNLFGEITRIANIQAFLGASYEKSVNRQLQREEKEMDFVAKPLWNGKGIRINFSLAKHSETGKFYMSYLPLKTLKSFHFDQFTNLILNEVIKQYFYQSSNNQQGTEKEIFHREIAVENIRKFKMKGCTYIVKH
jgi:hypothetical protein